VEAAVSGSAWYTAHGAVGINGGSPGVEGPLFRGHVRGRGYPPGGVHLLAAGAEGLNEDTVRTHFDTAYISMYKFLPCAENEPVEPEDGALSRIASFGTGSPPPGSGSAPTRWTG